MKEKQRHDYSTRRSFGKHQLSIHFKTCKMVQPLKELATKPDDPNSSLRTHMVERANSHELSSDLHMRTLVHVCVYINIVK